MSPLHVSVYAVIILILGLAKTAMVLRLPRFSFPKFPERNYHSRHPVPRTVTVFLTCSLSMIPEP